MAADGTAAPRHDTWWHRGIVVGLLCIVGAPACVARIGFESQGKDCATCAAGDPSTTGADGGPLGDGPVGDAILSGPPVAQLATGGAHTCAITTSGELACWGWNRYGQLGTPDPRDLDQPAQIPGDFLDVSLSGGHTCAVSITGQVSCWGRNNTEQLGDDSIEDGIAVAVAGSVPFGGHSCAIRGSPARPLHCWGSNDFGQLGDGSNVQSAAPVATGLTAVDEVAVGPAFSCARQGGTVFCWGTNFTGQLGDGGMMGRNAPQAVGGIDDAVQLVLGDSHACVRHQTGRVSCWGGNGDGQLGLGHEMPQLVPTAVPGLIDAVDVTAGGTHTCVVRTGGESLCWGSNTFGELGDGTTLNRSSPSITVGLAGVARLHAGGDHTCALLATGSIRCWGWNAHGQLGVGAMAVETSPTAGFGIQSATALSAGANHTCAIQGQRFFCTGDNANGQLGDGTTVRRQVFTLQAGDRDFSQLSVGDVFGCAVATGTQQAYCWGSNVAGRLGNGTMVDSLSATPVGMLAVNGIGCGSGTACGISVTADELFCWGVGPLGNGASTGNPTPVSANGLSNVVEVRSNSGWVNAGSITQFSGHSCARDSSDELWCWGWNGQGQLGDGTTTDRLVPTNVLSSVAHVVTGARHTCAIIRGAPMENVVCFGANDAGQLGDGTGSERWTPAPVVGITTAIALASGPLHTCALLSGGAVQCWGDNQSGQLGDQTTTSRNVPAGVLGLADAVGLAAGGDLLRPSRGHTCARRTGGAVVCWGSNSHGQLGTDTLSYRTAPAPVDWSGF